MPEQQGAELHLFDNKTDFAYQQYSGFNDLKWKSFIKLKYSESHDIACIHFCQRNTVKQKMTFVGFGSFLVFFLVVVTRLYNDICDVSQGKKLVYFQFLKFN